MARRTIFFARYEASLFGSPCIESEHLLLGLLREDKPLANRFLGSFAAVESIRQQIEGRTTPREKISTSVDLPLSHQCRCAVAYAAEEAERLEHKHIGTEHLLLGLLREKTSVAAQLLDERGLTLSVVRAHAQQSEPVNAHAGSTPMAGLEQWVAERETPGGAWTIKRTRVGLGTIQFALYASAEPKENEKRPDAALEKLALIQKRIESLVRDMENAIGNHEFEKARFYSEEERKERENMRLLREQFHVEEPPARVPLLCIEIIRADGLREIQKRCDEYIAGGVAEVWLLDPDFKRAYTANKTEGLSEFKGEILRIADPPLEMDLRRIFSE